MAPVARVRAYLAGLPPDARRKLQQVRAAIRAAAPGAVEGFSYGMPGFTLDGRPLIWYAAWKSHVALYPVGSAAARALAERSDAVETSKGTIRFPIAKPPSAAFVKRLVKVRVAEVRKTSRGAGGKGA